MQLSENQLECKGQGHCRNYQIVIQEQILAIPTNIIRGFLTKHKNTKETQIKQTDKKQHFVQRKISTQNMQNKLTKTSIDIYTYSLPGQNIVQSFKNILYFSILDNVDYF